MAENSKEKNNTHKKFSKNFYKLVINTGSYLLCRQEILFLIKHLMITILILV